MAGAKLISKALQAAREAFSGRNVSPLGFYSKGAEEAAALRQPKGTPEQMRSMLINKQGVKATELDNAGFNDAFAGRPSVTREEIAKLLQDRAPKIEETVLGKQAEISDKEFAKKYDELYENYIAERGRPPQNDAWLREWVNEQRGFETAESAAKYSKYQLPGGENYREAVLKLPATKNELPQFKVIRADGHVDGTYANVEGANARAAAINGTVQQAATKVLDGGYRSSHWDDSNVLAHLRMSDRTDPTGRKILHLEELQSDWAQEGRKMGFLDPQIELNYNKHIKELALAKKETRKLMKIASDRLGQENPRFEDAVRAVPELKIASDRQSDLFYNIPAIPATSGIPAAPYVTKTQDWTDLALKRALREAAEGNYDAIAWTPGKTQAARYPGGTPEDEAKRLKGMIGYYDKMVPTQLQKLARDLDPNVAIERMRIPVQGQNTSAEDIARQLNMSVDQVAALPIDQKLQLIGSVRNTMELPSLTVTPEMREKIKQGLPLFTAPAVGLGAASQMQSGETPVTDEPRLDFAGGGGARKTPVTDESKPTDANMADDYTLFSRRNLRPYGQSYAPNTSGRFEQGNMRIRQMQRAQEQATSGADFTPPDWEDNRPVKFANRARPIYVGPGRIGPNPRPDDSYIADMNTWPPTYPREAATDRFEQSAGERAIAAAKSLPQQVYRAVTNPVETAKAVANAVLSGEDYQSTSDPVVQNGVINWGDPDNSADFFRADQALQELHPYVEPETPPEPANERYSNGGIVSELLNEVVDFVNPGFAGGGEVGGEYDYVEPEMVYDDEYDYVEPETVYDDEYDYVEPETVYDDEYDYVEPEMAEDLDGFAHGGPALMQDEYPTEYLPEVGRQVMAGGGEVDNPIVDEAYGEPMGDRARMRQTVANIQPDPEPPGDDMVGDFPPVQVMEPDMLRAQQGSFEATGETFTDDQGRLVDKNFNPVEIIRRPSILPITSSSEGLELAMPKILDILGWGGSNIFGKAPAGALRAGMSRTKAADDAVETAKALSAAKQLFKGSDLIKKNPAAAIEKLSERTPSGDVDFGQALKNYEYSSTKKGDLQPWKEFSPVQAYKEDAILAGILSDRSAAGRNVDTINGVKLRTPVNLKGGGDFQRSLEGPEIWASRPSAVKGMQTRIRKNLEELKVDPDNPVFASTVLMSKPAIDSTQMMAKAMLRQIEATRGKIDPKVAGELDAYIRKSHPDWPGVLSPVNAERWLAENEVGNKTSTILQAFDKAGIQRGGLPNLGSARFAMMDPRLVTAEHGASGFAVSRLDPKGATNKAAHDTYPVGMLGPTQSSADYLGGTKYQVPLEVMFPDWYKTVKPTYVDKRSGLTMKTSPTMIQQSALTQVPVQRATQEWLDNIMKHYEGNPKPWGYANGGEVDNPIVDEAYGEPMSDRASMRQTVANIQPREGEEVRADGEGWQRALQNYRNFPVRPGGATMRPRDDWRANAAAVIAGEGGPSYGSELRRRAGEALFGPTYGIGLTDVLGLPTLIDAAQAYRKGNTGEAAINLATLGIPFAAAARKPIANAVRAARDVITSPAGRTAAAGATGAAVMSPDDAEAANILKALKAIGAYHGSPHKFDKFDISKVGTGEGAQAYGHGMYFAENEGVAKGYRKDLSSGTYATQAGDIFDPYKSLEHLNVRVASQKGIDNGIKRAEGLLSTTPELSSMIRRDLDKLYALKAKNAVPNEGHMYEVNINADPAKFLEWEVPFSNQSETVQNVLREMGVGNKWNDSGVLGSEAYKRISGKLAPIDKISTRNDPLASDSLLKSGIPGIKYLDAGSRPEGRGTSNYAVFDPSIVEILRRYAHGGPVEEYT